MLSFGSYSIFSAQEQKNYRTCKQRNRSHISHFQMLLMEKRRSQDADARY